MIQVNNDNVTSYNEKISLKELILKIGEWWRYFRSKWKVIVFTVILGSSIGLTYAFFQKFKYVGELSFALEDDKSSGGIGGAIGLASQFGIDLGNSGGGAFSGDNLLALMKSRSMVEKSLLSTITINNKSTTLVELYISFNKVRKGWEENEKLKKINFLPGADRSKFTLQQDSILGSFCNTIIKTNLTVDKLDKKLSIFNIKVVSENESFSKYFTEILAKTVSDFFVDTKTKKAVQNVNILQRQTDSVRNELNIAINGVASSVDNNPNANPALQILRVPSQRRQVDVQANTAILNQLVTNLEISKVTLRKETPLIQVIDRPILPLGKEKFGKLKGIVLGGFIAGVVIVIVLFFKKLFSDSLR